MNKLKLKRYGFAFQCHDHGTWISEQLIRKFSGGPAFLNSIGKGPRVPQSQDKPLRCPHCRKWLTVQLMMASSQTRIDSCSTCKTYWFDLGEIENAEKSGELEDLFPSAIRRAANSGKVQRPRENITVQEGSLSVMGLLGLPEEVEVKEQRDSRAGTLLLIAACFVFTAKFLKSGAGSSAFVFDPLHPFRNYGLTLFTSLWAHGNWWHFFSNAYFLFLLGSRLESRLGTLRLYEIFFIAGAGESIITSYMGFTSPALGASSGVFGLLGYSAIAYPNDRYTFIKSVGNPFPHGSRVETAAITVSTIALLGWYVLTESLAAFIDLNTYSPGSAAVSHLSGAFLGILVYSVLHER